MCRAIASFLSMKAQFASSGDMPQGVMLRLEIRYGSDVHAKLARGKDVRSQKKTLP